jgi:hypothetical protein
LLEISSFIKGQVLCGFREKWLSEIIKTEMSSSQKQKVKIRENFTYHGMSILQDICVTFQASDADMRVNLAC